MTNVLAIALIVSLIGVIVLEINVVYRRNKFIKRYNEANDRNHKNNQELKQMIEDYKTWYERTIVKMKAEEDLNE